ncbi:unnamed protein product, partial [Vitis vinifera]|uniref:Uncharacterized protein n=1 Tax=Vitis vinifera TaxID=29760 RepID=D7SVS6_VITVI
MRSARHSHWSTPSLTRHCNTLCQIHNGENWRKRKGLALIIVKELGIPTLFQISNSIFSIVCFGGVGDKPITPSIQGSAPHFEN